MTKIKASQRKGKGGLAALTANSSMSDTAVLTSTIAFGNTSGGNITRMTNGFAAEDLNTNIAGMTNGFAAEGVNVNIAGMTNGFA